mmetsp:Transcript_79583/g.234010  ORF Transcript_79583/g.234010 Transcript_79583/m.234010 type:complete len:259 (+) Transcript_79583:298-1074(+)
MAGSTAASSDTQVAMATGYHTAQRHAPGWCDSHQLGWLLVPRPWRLQTGGCVGSGSKGPPGRHPGAWRWPLEARDAAAACARAWGSGRPCVVNTIAEAAPTCKVCCKVRTQEQRRRVCAKRWLQRRLLCWKVAGSCNSARPVRGAKVHIHEARRVASPRGAARGRGHRPRRAGPGGLPGLRREHRRLLGRQRGVELLARRTSAARRGRGHGRGARPDLLELLQERAQLRPQRRRRHVLRPVPLHDAGDLRSECRQTSM